MGGPTKKVFCSMVPCYLLDWNYFRFGGDNSSGYARSSDFCLS